MKDTVPARATVIADAAIGVVASDGLRGLTHRAVDTAAGLPQGSTSYYARTRLALLELAVNRIVEVDEDRMPPPAENIDQVAGELAGWVHEAITTGRDRMLAHFEFALEASRRPELRSVYDRAGARLRDGARERLRLLGSATPTRHARTLLSCCDGMIFDAIAGTGSARPPTRRELHTDLRVVLGALLPVSR